MPKENIFGVGLEKEKNDFDESDDDKNDRKR